MDPSDSILVVGDYNLPNLTWNLDEDIGSYLPTNSSTEQEIALVECLFSLGLYQINSVTNANNKLLDLFFVSDTSSWDLIDPPSAMLRIDAHHQPVVLLYSSSELSEHSSEQCDGETALDFRRSNGAALNDLLDNIDWNDLLTTPSIDNAVETLYCKINTVLQENVPKKKLKIGKPSRIPWWNPTLTNLNNRLRKARKKYRISRCAATRNALVSAENEFHTAKVNYFHEYMREVQSNLRNNPASFWGYVKSRRNNHAIPHSMQLNGKTADTEAESTELFKDFFSSVFVQETASCANLDSQTSHSVHLPLPTLCESRILASLNHLDATKGAGPDGWPPYFVKLCARSLSKPLTLIYNRSLRSGIFPSRWKIASIIPIHKSGNIHHVKNYRGISILNCVAKVFESILHDLISDKLMNLISGHQHGFVKGRSTVTNLMVYVPDIINSIEHRKQVDAIYIDFSKAFDRVPHRLATEKLRKLGLPDWITSWIYSYLTNRTAFVRIKNTVSETFEVPSGVPQGSHLGPLIFNLFINDICSLLSSNKLLYADDLKIFRTINSVLDCIALQADVDAVLKWCVENGMEANPVKCKVISFYRGRNSIPHSYNMGNEQLERVESIRDLGVLLNHKMTFSDHINAVTAKAYSLFGFLARNAKAFRDVHTLKALYCTLVRSGLEYAVQVWAPYEATLINKIEKIQRKFVKYALRFLPWTNRIILPPYEHRCQLIDLPTLQQRRLTLRRVFVFDLLQGNINCSELVTLVHLRVPRPNQRTTEFLHVPFHRTS